MSKIGKLPVKIPKGVMVQVSDSNIDVSGPKGKLSRAIHQDITVKVDEGSVVVTRPTDLKPHKALHGLTRALIQNMVIGVSQGYRIELEMIGVGYRAEMKGKLLELSLGFSHPILMRPPDDVKLEIIPKESKIIVTGPDKQLVGQTAAQIRKFRPPEPYKGKGVRYVGEMVRRKAGKAAGK
ncbi:MAG: 50S ribosomal protein L6 [Candidatus Zixiibacteriota bacterium]